MARLIRPGDLVVDGGANVGYMSILMGLCAGGSGDLVSFEPHPGLFDTLSENLRELQQRAAFPRTMLHNTALSDKPGRAMLVIPPDFHRNDGTATLSGSAQSGTSMTVKAETIDEILDGRSASVVKLDVEGHELAVLTGALDTLRERRIRHFVYEDHFGASSPISELLFANGFTLFQIGWQTFGPVLASIESRPVCKPYEAPSYLATLDRSFVETACRTPGWRVLRLRPMRSSSK
jgi:FkbM family methyltransferase